MRLFRKTYQPPKADAEHLEVAGVSRDVREDYMIQTATDLIYETEACGRPVVAVGITYLNDDGTLGWDSWGGDMMPLAPVVGLAVVTTNA